VSFGSTAAIADNKVYALKVDHVLHVCRAKIQVQRLGVDSQRPKPLYNIFMSIQGSEELLHLGFFVVIVECVEPGLEVRR
jgi:hypothetical protein